MATDQNTQVWGGTGDERYHGEDVAVALLGPVGVNPSGWTLRVAVVAVVGGTPLTLANPTPTVTGPDAANKYTITMLFSRADTGAVMTGDEYQVDVWRIDSGSYQRLAGGVLRLATPDYPQT